MSSLVRGRSLGPCESVDRAGADASVATAREHNKCTNQEDDTVKRQLAAGIAVLAAAGAAIAAPAAGAKTGQTLSFYQVSGRAHFHNAAGEPININPPATLPAAGDGFDEIDTLYVGTAKRHAKQWSATDHMTCTFSNSSTGTCDLQIAIGGSMLLFNQFVLHFEDNSAVVRLSEGTGQFKRAHGSLSIVDLANGNSSFVVELS